jgi:hypothetical protein
MEHETFRSEADCLILNQNNTKANMKFIRSLGLKKTSGQLFRNFNDYRYRA